MICSLSSRRILVLLSVLIVLSGEMYLFMMRVPYSVLYGYSGYTLYNTLTIRFVFLLTAVACMQNLRNTASSFAILTARMQKPVTAMNPGISVISMTLRLQRRSWIRGLRWKLIWARQESKAYARGEYPECRVHPHHRKPGDGKKADSHFYNMIFH